MRAILRQAEQDAIFREPPLTLRTAGEVVPFMPPWLAALPDHDWTQHNFGGPEDWTDDPAAPRQIDAVLDESGNHQFPGMDQLQPTGESSGSSHGAEIHQHPASGEKWLVKPAHYAPFMAAGDVAANAVQQASGLPTPPTFLTEHEGLPASAQLMFDAKDAFPSKKINPETISDPDLLTVQKHHALDWMIGNHDSHPGQFIRDHTGQMIGIDKGQAFKYFNTDPLSWNFRPNEHEPIHNQLYRNMAKGGRVLNDPREGELGQYIQGLQDIPDEEYQNVLRPYAEHAAAEGGLGKQWHSSGLNPQPRFKPNDVDGFLQAATDRKNNLMQDMGNLHDKAHAYRATGTKIARVGMPVPQGQEMDPTGQELGTNGSKVWSDPQGKWLMKKPRPGNEFLVPLETGMAHLQQRAGLETPETYSMPMPDTGDIANAVKMYPNATMPFDPKKPPRLDQLSPEDADTVQKHHAIDWLTSNYDGHGGNWVRTQQGQLVGLDKGQSMKYFGRDRLDPSFRPIYYGPEPIYNQLWKDHSQGRGAFQDPRTGSMGDFVQNLQNIPDEEFKGIFRPFANAAAHAGMLGTGSYTGGGIDPRRGLTPSSIPPNDPEAFLHGLTQRKNNLSNDLGKFYDQQSANRPDNQQQTLAVPAGEGLHRGAIHREGGPLTNLLTMGQGAGTSENAATSGLPKPPAPPPISSPPGVKQPGVTGVPGVTGQPASSPQTTDPNWAAGHTKGFDAAGMPTNLGQFASGQVHAPAPGATGPQSWGDTSHLPFTPGSGASSSGQGGASGAAPGVSSVPGATPTSTGTGGPGAPSTYTPSGGVDQWTSQIQEGLRRNGLPVTDEYVNKVKHQMQTESSGNPKAINNDDINAIQGHPSQGLMQTIPSTFQQYHLQGDSNDITDPQANIDSALGYAKSVYGPTLQNSSGGGVGSGHGY